MFKASCSFFGVIKQVNSSRKSEAWHHFQWLVLGPITKQILYVKDINLLAVASVNVKLKRNYCCLHLSNWNWSIG